MAKLAATPYDTHAGFFFFDSAIEFDGKAEDHQNEFGDHVEEYEIQFIDGDEDECLFAKLWEPNQANLEDWFDKLDDFERLDDNEKIAVCYLMDDRSMEFGEAMAKAEDVCIMEGTPEDHATELVNEGVFGQLTETAWRYFDTEALGRDMDLNGEIDTYRHDGTDYVITNASEF